MKTNHTIIDKGAPQVQPGCKAVLRRLCGAALLLLLAGCADDPAENILPPTADGETVTMEFSLAPDVFSEVEVKAAGAVDENIISDVWVIQHKSDGSGQLQNPVYIGNLTRSADGRYRAEVKLTAQDSKVYLLANTHKSDLCTATNTKDKATLENLSMSYSTQADIASDKGVLMTGIWEGTPSPTVGIVGAVPLSRAVSKVTFDLSAQLPAGAKLELSQIVIDQIPTEIFPFSEKDVSLGYNFKYNELGAYSGTSLSDAPQKFTFYVPECLGGTTNGVSPGDKIGPVQVYGICLVVVGGYSFAGIYGQQTTFRLYLGENNYNDYNVRRNTHYQVTSVIKGNSDIDTRIERKSKAWLTGNDYTGFGYCWVYLPTMKILGGVNRLTYAEAKDFCANYYSPKSNQWRLPTLDELKLAVTFLYDDICSNMAGSSFWSDTPVPEDLSYRYTLRVSDRNSGWDFSPESLSGKVYPFCVHDVEPK